MKDLPDNCEHVYVTVRLVYRYKHYKTNSQQYKKGILGRWQKFNGYGWDNCDAPESWKHALEPPEIEK